MAEAGRSLKTFYIVLGLVAVVGIALIVRAASSRPSAPLVMADCSGPPLGGVAPKGVTLGPDSAPVKITEYADFECPACARLAILTMPDVEQRLIPTGKVQWTWMDFPLPQHANSPLAHVAAECAADQGKFWQMEYALYYHQDDWFADANPEGKFLDYARQTGLNADSFRVCVDQRRPWPTIEANKCSGDKLGINETPTLVVNGRAMPGAPAFDDLQRLVDSLSAHAAPAAARR
jgi:protein-disulfide isomerase